MKRNLLGSVESMVVNNPVRCSYQKCGALIARVVGRSATVQKIASGRTGRAVMHKPAKSLHLTQNFKWQTCTRAFRPEAKERDQSLIASLPIWPLRLDKLRASMGKIQVLAGLSCSIYLLLGRVYHCFILAASKTTRRNSLKNFDQVITRESSACSPQTFLVGTRIEKETAITLLYFRSTSSASTMRTSAGRLSMQM